MEREIIEEFLQELTKLSKKYKIYINGCGCCGSPYLTEKEPEVISPASEIGWDKEKQKYVLNMIPSD